MLRAPRTSLHDGAALAFNQPGLDEQLPQHIHDVERRLAAAKAAGAVSSEVAGLERHLRVADLTFSTR